MLLEASGFLGGMGGGGGGGGGRMKVICQSFNANRPGHHNDHIKTI